MRPTQSDVHVNKPLTSILIAYFQDEAKGIANKVFPTVPVSHKTDLYYQWNREDFYRLSVAERAPGTPSEGGDFGLTQGSYNCKEFAVHKDLADPVVDNEDEVLDLEQAAARWVGSQLALKREKAWFDKYFTTSVWGTDRAGVASGATGSQFNQWDGASSTPIEDIRESMFDMEAATGFLPNTLVLGPFVWKALADHAELLDRIKYTEKGVVMTDLLASLLGLDRVFIGRMVINSAKEGATESNAYISGKHALLLYSASTPSKLEPSAGYTFAWTKRFGAGPNGERIKKFRMEDIESDRVEGQINYDQKVVCSDLGIFYNGAVA